MTSLPEIVDNGLCHGCGGCVAAIDRSDFEMVMEDDGFARPSRLGLNQRERDILEKVCSGKTLVHGDREEPYHPLWGPLHSVSTAHATDPDIRYAGSSGGVISALCNYLVETGEVDFVLATGAAAEDPIGNRTEPRKDRTSILAAAGSRYAPSSPLADLEHHLAGGRPFAFVGKPCDVATLRRMARQDERIDRLIPYKLSFFCAGIPSRHATIDVLHALGVKQADVAKFRYRGEGWPGRAKAQRHDGSEASMTYQESWGEILGYHLQSRCKICPDGTGEFADLACADAWYGDDGYPSFEEQEGRSLLVVRTLAGEQLARAAEAAGVIVSQPLPVGDIELMQPYQAKRKRSVTARTAAMWIRRGTGPKFRKLGLTALLLRSNPVNWLRNFHGMWRRLR